jgi:hypothetical protein
VIGKPITVAQLRALPPVAPKPRRVWWKDSPVLRRPWCGKWQLSPSVWVCMADLRVLVLPAREAMATHDPYSQIDPDGVDRTYIRCTRDVWRALQTRRQPAAIDHIRAALSAVYTIDGIVAPTPAGVA